MAFLLPALVPALQALGLGALSGLGVAAAKKVVGDAVPEDQLGQVLALGLQNPNDPLVSSVMSPTQIQSLNSMKGSMESSPTLWFTPQALSFQRGTGMQVMPQITNHNDQIGQSQVSQNIADSAALQQFPSTQMALGQSHNVRMNPHQALSAWDIRNQNPGVSNLLQNSSNQQALMGQPQASQNQYSTMSLQDRNVNLDMNRLAQQPQMMTSADQSSKLSIHPQTGLAIAEQPHNKLLHNQGNIIAAPSALGGINPQAPGVAGAYGGQGVVTTIQNEGNALLNAVKNAGSAAASGAISSVGGVAQNVAAQGLKKAGGWFGNLISSGLTNLAKKVIGDALPDGSKPEGRKVVGDAPPGGSFLSSHVGYIPPTVREVTSGIGDSDPLAGHGGLNGLVSAVASKIVGDAPPGGVQGDVMTDDQQNAAIVNLQESVIFNLMSRLVLNEQILVQSTSMPLGLNEAQLNNYFARDLEALVGTYRQTEVQSLFGLKGMSVSPGYSIEVYSVDKTGAMAAQITDLGYVFASGCAVESSRVGPPLTTNETLTRLAPLLAGAALGEYSSQLRIKTYSTDVDLMMRGVASTINNIQAQTGYSFCLPLVKMMGYMLQRVTLLGDELNQLSPNWYWSPAKDEKWSRAGKGFPLQVKNDGDVYNDLSWSGAQLAVISDANFIKAFTGVLSTNNWNDFHPANWGITCAVVFVPQNDCSNARANAVRMAAQMGYPIEIQRCVGTVHWYTRTEAFSTASVAGHYVYKNSSLVYIPGPYKVVLFVVLNSRESAGVGLNLGDGVSADADHMVHLNATDNPPNNPHVVGEGNTAEGRALRVLCDDSCITDILSYIKEWEYTFGNASDRSSAMRFWADHAYRWQNCNFICNAYDIGGPQTISFHSIFNRVVSQGKSGFRDYSDIPLPWETAAKAITKDGLRYLLQTSRTSTQLPVAAVSTPIESSDDFKWTNGAPADSSRLPYEDYLVSYLVLRRWVTCNEEYPEVVINDPGRFAHTICVMANLMTGASDLTAQQADFSLAECFCTAFILRQSPASSLRVKNILWPSLEQILQNGIQYPQYWNNRDVNFHCWASYTYWDVVYPQVYPEAIVKVNVMASVSRVPMSIMGQWYKPLYPQYIHLRLNLAEMKPQRVYVTSWENVGGVYSPVKRLLYQCFISEEQTGLMGRALAPISWLAWRLSLGVVASSSSGNNGFKAQIANSQEIVDYLVHFEHYDASRNQVIVREFGEGNVTVPPTTAAALPTGEFLMKRNIGYGLQPVAIVMQGPRDAFIGVGIGSTAYQMFVQTNSPQALFVTQSWSTVPDWLFSERGLLSNRDTI